MNRFKRLAGVLTVTALAATGLAGVAQAATNPTAFDVHKSDFIAGLSDTRGTGYYGFGPKGLVIRTDDSTSTSKVAEYYADQSTTVQSLPYSMTQDWTGSQPEPGMQIVFDADDVTGNGNDDNILVGEKVYNQPMTEEGYGADVWLTSGSSSYAKLRAPSCDGSPAVGSAKTGAEQLALIANRHCVGGSGSPWHGSLYQWDTTQSPINNGPGDAGLSGYERVIAYGFSLGSGVKGDGVLKSQSFDSVTGNPGVVYTFREGSAPVAASPVVDVTGSAVKVTHKHGVTFKMRTAALPAGATQGKGVRWVVKVNGTKRYSSLDSAGSVHNFRYNVPNPGSRQVKHIVLYRNGVQYLRSNRR